jgi:hypothetical protein
MILSPALFSFPLGSSARAFTPILSWVESGLGLTKSCLSSGWRFSRKLVLPFAYFPEAEQGRRRPVRATANLRFELHHRWIWSGISSIRSPCAFSRSGLGAATIQRLRVLLPPPAQASQQFLFCRDQFALLYLNYAHHSLHQSTLDRPR